MNPAHHPWLPRQLQLLEELADAKVPWSEIARQTGHPKTSCATKMSELRRNRLGEEEHCRIALRKRLKRPAKLQAPPRPADPPHVRVTSTAKLVTDAELRSRIEVTYLEARRWVFST